MIRANMKPELRGKDFRIGDVLHDAWAFDPKLWRRDQMGVAEDFGPAVTRLLEPVPCATVEGLLLLKLYALPSLYRQGEFVRIGLFENDAASLLHAYRPQIEPLLAELGEHLSESDLAAVRTLVAELQRRFQRRFGPHQAEISGSRRN